MAVYDFCHHSRIIAAAVVNQCTNVVVFFLLSTAAAGKLTGLELFTVLGTFYCLLLDNER